ncbi:MAG: ribulokinase [Clostridia bacterium]|nr:ribulokinase [Clostridia bacterium]
MKKYTIGLDFGSLSCRGILADTSDGRICAEAVMDYPHGVMTEALPDGTPLEGDVAFQHSRDFREALEAVVKELVNNCPSPENIVGIAMDTTVSTVLAVDENLIPLCEKSEFAAHPQAWVKMWKHHGATEMAKRVEEICKEQNRPYLDWYGGSISPESLFMKAIEAFTCDREVYGAAECFIELADYLTLLLAGKPTFSLPLMKAKAFYDEKLGYPDAEFLRAYHPDLISLPQKLTCAFKNKVVAHPGTEAASLCPEIAKKLGLPEGITVSAGTADSYSPILGIGITGAGQMIMTIGTSTGIMIMSDGPHFVAGVTASLPDIYYAGKHGYASGQTSSGDALGWFANNCVPARYEREAEEKGISVQSLLTEKATLLPPGSGGVMALDWLNGNKSCLANPHLSGLFVGLTLSTRPEQMYRALIEATAFGARAIIENYEKSGVPVREIRAAGGIVGKNKLLMQIYADVIGLPIMASRCPQVPALGAAINAACAAGEYSDIESAVKAMSCKDFDIYTPNPENHEKYERLYAEYITLHDYFGKGGNKIMEKLRGKI